MVLLESVSCLGKNNGVIQTKDCGNNELLERIEAIIPILEKINSGEVCLDSEINEEWDDWYNSDAEEFFFSDP